MFKKGNIITAVFLLSLSILFAGRATYASAEEDNRICKGVFIDEVDVSNMTGNEAKAAIDNYIKELGNQVITINAGENTATVTLGELGYSGDENDAIVQALALGKTGNLIKQYKDLKDIEHGNVVFPITYTVDDSKIKSFISENLSQFNVAPVDATVTRKDGEFIYTDHVVGKKIDENQTLESIKSAILNWDHKDIVIDAVYTDDMPTYTREDVEKCKDLLGSYTTDFSSSSSSRAGNLANGARLINNTVLYPGEVFSAYEHLTPFTAENGYFLAGAYLEGRVIDSVGGGACQVTTTLYNAVLASELEVVERQPHSMTISYVDLSRDAAIAGTYKDFKFRNNTEVPIVIEGSTYNRKITFKIWGCETRDVENRKIEYVSVIKSSTPPPADKITEDPTLPTTYKKVTQSAHTGYKAELYKVVYVNGKEVSRELVNTSTYNAAPRYITVGTKEEEEEKPEDEKDDKKDKKDKDKKKEPQVDELVPEEVDDTDGGQNNSGNAANPDDQLQSDVWDPAWDEEVEE